MCIRDSYWFHHHDTVGSTATGCCWLHGVRGYDARIWRICDAAAALLFAADAVVVDAAAAAAASRSDGRPMMMMMMSVPVVVDDSLSIRAMLHPVRPSYSTPGRPVALLEGRGKRGMNYDFWGLRKT